MLCFGCSSAAAQTGLLMQIERSVLVPYKPLDMFRLVRDVPAYPEFLRWCSDAEVHEQTEEFQLATLEVSIGNVRQRFTTRNVLRSGEYLSMSLVDGPFRRLQGEWRFESLGDVGSKVSLHMGFEFSNTLLSAAFRNGFARISERMVGDFGRRADAIYG